MTQFLYNLLFPFVFLAMLPGFLLRMLRRGNYRHRFGQRFGIYSHAVRQRIAGRRCTWMHAVSVGEVGIALKLAREMKRLEPDLELVLSTTTSTGFALARERSEDWMEIIYNPVDFLPFVRSAMNLIRPRRIVMVEAEVWPNLTWLAARNGIPMALVNARLSPRSARRFEKFRFFTGPIFRRLSFIGVCELEDVQTWGLLGVDTRRVHCTGSIKFDHARDAQPDGGWCRELLASLGVSERTQLLLAGSTHAGEEMLLAEIHRDIRSEDSLLVVAPRHVERVEALAGELAEAGFTVLRRSALPAPSGTPRPDVLILDTTGELAAWYAVGTVVFIGKSMLAHGGQNPVEAVVAGCPVVCGPHMENFPVITAKLLEAGAARQVTDAEQLRVVLAELLEDEALRAEMLRGACAVLAPHRGAAERTAQLLRKL